MHGNWELTWSEKDEEYDEEEDRFAGLFNVLIKELDESNPPPSYHDNEDRLAEYVQDNLGWNIYKENGHWIGADYKSILNQGGFDDIDQNELILAAAGRIKAAQDYGQEYFDDMEWRHKQMLATVPSSILYHRY